MQGVQALRETAGALADVQMPQSALRCAQHFDFDFDF